MEFLDKVSALSGEIHHSRPLGALTRVECDQHSVRLRAPLPAGRSRRFAWSEIAAACYVAAQPGQAGVLVLDLERDFDPACVFMESDGAQALFSGLIERGIFPLAHRGPFAALS